MLKQTKLLLLFILSLISSSLCQDQLQSECYTPNGEEGTCIPIRECPQLLTLFKKKNRSIEELQVLRNSRCDVCCEITNDTRCYNPDGNLSVCLPVTECPTIRKMLERDLSTENLRSINNSRCKGSDEYSICCGPDPVSNVEASNVCELSSAPPDPRTECCGLENFSRNKIYGEYEVYIDQHPWLTLIEYIRREDNEIKLLCSGALISSKYVLTAGHCVVGPVLNIWKPKNVRLGEYDIYNEGPDCVKSSGGGEDCTYGAIIISIQKVIPHREYLLGLRRNDIALIRMTNNAPYNEFIRPICLPSSDVTQSSQNLVLYAAGWGTVASNSPRNIKLHVDLPYKPLEVCQKAYNVSNRKFKPWNRHMCAGGESDKHTCRGNSGGPLMYDNGRIYSIVGVVSFESKLCALKDVPEVYTKVYEYIPWIRSNIKP